MNNWNEFAKFSPIKTKYLPFDAEATDGAGTTKATQVVAAVYKLINGFRKNGDVYDNTYGLSGWCNDISSYANWLYNNTTKKAKTILLRIKYCQSWEQYYNILLALSEELLDEDYLVGINCKPCVGSITFCDGPFQCEGEDDILIDDIDDDFELDDDEIYDDDDEEVDEMIYDDDDDMVDDDELLQIILEIDEDEDEKTF